MSNMANFDSSGLQNRASKKRRQELEPPLSGLLDVTDGNDDFDMLVGEIDDGRNRSSSRRTTKTKSSKPRPKTRQAQASRKTRNTQKKSTQRSVRRSSTRLPQRKSKSLDLKATAAPLLATVGVLLLVPAFWSLLLLAGVNVPGSDREDAGQMAAIMLVSWPIAICLIVAAVFFFLQIAKEKKQARLNR